MRGWWLQADEMRGILSTTKQKLEWLGDGQVTTGPSSLATQARLVVTVSLGVGCWVLGGVDLMSYAGMSLDAVATYPSMW